MADAFFTRAPSTIVTITLTGQVEFTIPFEFLARKFVVVTLLGTDRKVLTLGTDYRFVAVNKIRLERQPEGDYTRIELRRYTSTTDRLVSFIDGSILRATDLNLAQVQTMHVAEEARDIASDTIGINDDGDLDARNRKIVNLADGVNPLDAVNLGQLRQFDTSTGHNADSAERSAAGAKVSELNAASSETRCVTAEAKAVSSAGVAMTAAADANSSKVAAKQSEDNAALILADVVSASGPSTELVAKVNKASSDAATSLSASTSNTARITTLETITSGDVNVNQGRRINFYDGHIISSVASGMLDVRGTSYATVGSSTETNIATNYKWNGSDWVRPDTSSAGSRVLFGKTGGLLIVKEDVSSHRSTGAVYSQLSKPVFGWRLVKDGATSWVAGQDWDFGVDMRDKLVMFEVDHVGSGSTCIASTNDSSAKCYWTYGDWEYLFYWNSISSLRMVSASAATLSGIRRVWVWDILS